MWRPEAAVRTCSSGDCPRPLFDGVSQKTWSPPVSALGLSVGVCLTLVLGLQMPAAMPGPSVGLGP